MAKRYMFTFLSLALLGSCPWVLSSPFTQSPNHRQHAEAYCTNSDLSLKLSPVEPPTLDHHSWSHGEEEKIWGLAIDDTPSGFKQTITGFGAAVTDATVVTFNQLPAAQLNRLLNELMTPAGADFALMRHTIGASDLSPDPGYTYDGQPANTADPSLAHFRLGEQGSAMAHLLLQMKTKNPSLKIIGSPWSPPGWMKKNHVAFGTTVDNNLSDKYLNNSDPDYSVPFADYFVKYIEAFATLGVPVDALTIQNEPLNSRAGFPTMYVYAEEAAKLIQRYVGPALRSAGLGTEVWAYDHNTDVPSYPQTVLTTASQYVDTVAWHCYASSLNWTVLSTFQAANPGVSQYMTECWTPRIKPRGQAAWFQAANFTIGPLQNWAKGVVAWTLGTDGSAGPHLSGEGACDACFGLVEVVEQQDGYGGGGHRYDFTPAYYLLAQFSRFMRPGSRVLHGSGSSVDLDAPGLQMVAAANRDGSRVVVFMNTLNRELFVRVSMASGEVWTGKVHNESVTTWVLPGRGEWRGW